MSTAAQHFHTGCSNPTSAVTASKSLSRLGLRQFTDNLPAIHRLTSTVALFVMKYLRLEIGTPYKAVLESHFTTEIFFSPDFFPTLDVTGVSFIIIGVYYILILVSHNYDTPVGL